VMHQAKLIHLKESLVELGVEDWDGACALSNDDLLAVGWKSAEIQRFRETVANYTARPRKEIPAAHATNNLAARECRKAIRGGTAGTDDCESYMKILQQTHAKADHLSVVNMLRNANVRVVLMLAQLPHDRIMSRRFELLGVASGRDLHWLLDRDLLGFGLGLEFRRRIHRLNAWIQEASPSLTSEGITQSATLELGQYRNDIQQLLINAHLPQQFMERWNTLGFHTWSDFHTSNGSLDALSLRVLSGMTIIDMRRLAATLRHLRGRSTGPWHSINANSALDPILSHPTHLPVNLKWASVMGPRRIDSIREGKAVKRAAPSNRLADGCMHVFIDAGSNRGDNIEALLGDWHAQAQRRAMPLQEIYDKNFGADNEYRCASVCAFGFEANAHHTPVLKRAEATYTRRGVRVHYFTETAVSTTDGKSTFFLDDGTHQSRHNGETAASLFKSLQTSGSGTLRRVRTVDLASFIATEILPRRLPPAESVGRGAAGFRPSVVLKADIEGAEFGMLSRLLEYGVLCQLQTAAVEFHDERQRNGHMVPILEASGAPRGFFDVLNFQLRSTPNCGVELREISPDWSSR